MATPAPATTAADQATRDAVRDYYGARLHATGDLQTNACTCADAPPPHIRAALANVHEDVLAKYYGCGLCVPDLVHGLRVLDLGCGSGRDVYILAQLVGEHGSVVGVDMTKAQLDVARATLPWHMKKFGYAATNVEFLEGYIERLDELGLSDQSFDLIVSNCVVNLSPDKSAVLREAHRLLRPGGEMYFSDVYADRRLPPAIKNDPVMYGECIGGALYWGDFLRLARAAGFTDPRLVSSSRITVANPELEARLGCARVYSAVYRLFKLTGLESECEDYGQAVVYKGTIERCPHAFTLDGHHVIETGKIFPVCGNTHAMLCRTRFSPHFASLGDASVHYGIFAGCGGGLPFDDGEAKGSCC